MSKILAFDPGTNSLGMVLRDTDIILPLPSVVPSVTPAHASDR